LHAQLAQFIAAGESSGIVHYAKGGDLLTLAVKVTADRNGHVITFEDVARQLLDQRRAAWSECRAPHRARQIKNPLTPIQFATERLKRRYRRQIEPDPELFEELTATIIRQVGDRRMVDGFSSFARLPSPCSARKMPAICVPQALFLQEVVRSASAAAGDTAVPFEADRHQFARPSRHCSTPSKRWSSAASLRISLIEAACRFAGG